jgi:hypothetical protein
MRSTKGQFYIIAAFILIVLAFAVLSYSSQTRRRMEKEDKFEQLYENYEEQSVDAINSALIEQGKYNESKHMQKRLNDFTMRFIEYAKTTEPGFNMLYAITYLNETEIWNYLNENASVNGDLLAHNQNLVIERPEQLVVEVEGYNYTFDIEKDIQLNTIFKLKKEGEMRIYVS